MLRKRKLIVRLGPQKNCTQIFCSDGFQYEMLAGLFLRGEVQFILLSPNSCTVIFSIKRKQFWDNARSPLVDHKTNT